MTLEHNNVNKSGRERQLAHILCITHAQYVRAAYSRQLANEPLYATSWHQGCQSRDPCNAMSDKNEGLYILVVTITRNQQTKKPRKTLGKLTAVVNFNVEIIM